MKTALFASVALLSLAFPRAEPTPPFREVDAFLARFRQDPKAASREAPSRWEYPGSPRAAVPAGVSMEARDRLRSRMCLRRDGKTQCLGDRIGVLAGIAGNDRPEELLEGGPKLIRSVEELDRLQLRQARLDPRPWSSGYWPYDQGIIGARYWDGGFPAGDWNASHDYVRANPASEIAASGSDFDVDLLSPAEKYDLLTGDPDFSLTRSMWQRGGVLLQETGHIDPWMGICNGWAAASFEVKRPSSAVEVPSADGRHRLRFYPSDLQALASALWADGEYETRFAGGRCRSSNPRTDANGRLVDPDCFDTNPATWHLAVTNRVGVAREGLIFDSSFDYEIWNQPVRAYDYGYFNPATGAWTDRLEEARVPLAHFPNDPFARYRSPQAVALVGIVMDLTYAAESQPTHAFGNGPDDDAARTVRYVYDLELDAEGNAIGGEWYTLQHPDFLWVPAKGARAASGHEREAVGAWDARSSLPESWRKAAKEAALDGLPLASVLEALLARASAD